MTDSRTIDLLKIHRSTRRLSDAQIERIASCAKCVEFRAGEIVHRAGEETNAMLLVASGELELSIIDADGGLQPIQYIGRDDQFGLLALFQTKPFPVAVRATQRSVAIEIAKPDVVALMRELPLWHHGLMQSLGPRLQEAFMAEKRKRRPRAVAILHATDAYRELTSWLARRLSGLDENVGLMSDHQQVLSEAPGVSESLVDSQGRAREREEIRSVAADWKECSRIFIDVGISQVSTDLAAIVAACDVVYCVCDQEHCQRMIDRLRRFLAESASWKEKLYGIRILRAGQQVADRRPELENLYRQDFKVDWDDSLDAPGCNKQSSLERIVHHLRGVSIGLALGGGAARGMAHLGALQVFENEGITVDRMSGTSAGALTGINYAAGFSADFLIETFARDLKPARYFRLLPYGDAWYMLGKYRRGGWDGMLRKYLRDWQLSQLPIPFTSVTADLVSAREIRRSACDATDAILESINLPGISRPICRDGMTLVDGGIFNVVPADVLVEQGANIVVAIDVSARIRFEFAGNTPDTPTDQMKVPSTVQTAVRMRTVQDRNIRSVGGSAADLVIEPDVSEVELSDFQNAPKIAVLGRTATEEALPKLRKILHQTDPQLFPQSR